MGFTDKNDEGEHLQSTEAQALSDIIDWSENLCMWQRDAMRRLCQFVDLTPTDVRELIDICKGDVDKARPISHNDISDPKSATQKVELKSIYDVENVNALAKGQRLSFSTAGINVVYGNNGSGKSGYARILKQSCYSREPKTAKIFPNIHDTQNEISKACIQKAHIQFVAEGQNRQIEWVKGETEERLLSSINIFDSNTANIHVNAENEVAYVPFPMQLLGRLADACKKIKETLQGEISNLTSQTPDSIVSHKLRAETKVGKAIIGLKSDTDPDAIRDIATFTSDDDSRLIQLEKDLSNDPNSIVKELNAKLRRIDALREKWEKLLSAISDERQVKLKELHAKYVTCKQASEITATKLFKDVPLPDVGGEEWKILWEAARQYSQKSAYIEKKFPVTDDRSHCVLCQQVLDADARRRLVSFEEFITDNAKQQEAEAWRIFNEFHKHLSAVSFSIAEISDFVLFCKDDLNDDNMAREIHKFFIKGKWRLRALLALREPLPNLPESAWCRKAIGDKKIEIDKRVSELTTDNIISLREKQIAEKKELEDRKWLNLMKNDVLAEIDRKKKIDKLDKLIKKETKTKQITEKSIKISENLITNALKNQFAKEIDEMELMSLPVELKQVRAIYGVPQFQISFVGNPDHNVGEILSEGEFRCVALAAFLAEIIVTQSKSAIVFDDPVSSLDHMHRDAVAKRLAKEALIRQVIIFTHDIYFLSIMNHLCRDNGIEIRCRYVTKRPDSTETGICHRDAPLKAQSVENLIKSFTNRLNKEKFNHIKGNETEWQETVISLLNNIRSTWELAVEEFVGVVVTRFGDTIKTDGLVSLTVLEIDDCQKMREAYGRCSKWLHSSSNVVNRKVPSSDEIQREINALEEWHNTLREKQRRAPKIKVNSID